MTPEKLQELRERFPTYSINTLSADEVHELLDHIATLESELQQVRVERDGMRSALERTLDCLRSTLAQRPVRDMAETFAEAEAALAPASAARTEAK